MIIKSIEPFEDMAMTHEGTARLVAEIFDQHNLNGPVTYVASLCVETSIFIMSVKRREFDTYSEARDQIATWASLYNLEAN